MNKLQSTPVYPGTVLNSKTVSRKQTLSRNCSEGSVSLLSHADGEISQVEEEGTRNVLVMTEVGRAVQGSMFGEKAIINPQKGRAVSVKCLRNCIFLVLAGKDYNKYMRRVLEKRDDNKINFLRSMPLFKSWSKGLARSFIAPVSYLHLKKGKQVVIQGHQNQFLFLIRAGTFRLTIQMKKPYREVDNETTLLRQEKYVLKDKIHEIERFNGHSLESLNHEIEGDDTGLMGANKDWKQIPRQAEQYVERME